MSAYAKNQYLKDDRGGESSLPRPNLRFANLIGPMRGLLKMFSSHVRRYSLLVNSFRSEGNEVFTPK